ncbi:unnamed protein product [Brassicogethes aeneus]|uniref:Cation-transporting ATPase n=1 Tax=Brassicogethes aeneus TaxID=1431903 RepID=A0A9P0BFC3_BRAAE|nr:unnamed protein product [Brassicogethes aeneus]
MMNNSRPYEYQNIDEIRYQQVLLLDNQDELKIYLYGYEQSKLNNVIYNFLGIIFLGIPFLIFNAWPQLKTIKFKKCPLETASVLLVLDHYGKYTLETVKTDKLKVPNIGPYNLRYFLYQHTKYVWDIEDKVFSTLDNLIPPNTVDDYLNNTSGLFDVDYIDLYKLFGPNKISVKIKSYWKLFFDEVFNPFYIFQVFSVVLWCVDDYMIYAGCVVVLTLFSSITSLIQTRKQSEAVHDLVESSVCHQVKVVRQNLLFEINELNINPVELVPGDLIILPPNNFVMPCDAVLLTGECIVNESVLTGESVPVTKTALHSSNDVYSIGGLHRRQTLFSGTTLIQTRYYENDDVLARVVRTGFDTTKGALVKSILFPSPVGLKFYRDSLKFVFVLFTIAAFGMAYCLYVYNERHAQLRYIITRALDIITIVVPPALPAAMAMGTVYSQARLKKAGIFCISPPIIPVCGKIKLACFDKTGTLTHDSLDMKSLIPCDRSQFTDPVTDICYVDLKSKLVQAMACCHDLTRIDGVLQGDPLDLIMFEFTKWEFEEPGNDENARFDKLAPTTVIPGKMCSKQVLQSEDDDLYQIGIIRKFPFSSTLQCMSVVSRNLQEPCMTAFVKGAPEKIKSMCNRESLPNNFDTLLSEYTVQGFRVIAIAYKNLPRKFTWKESQKAKREVIECNLNFLGFLVMQNLLKEQTVPALRTLQMANIRTVMITGDNILTAIAVARDCDMVKRHEQISVMSVIDEDNEQAIPRLHVENDGLLYGDEKCHLAIDGKTWEILKQHYSDLIPSVLVRATIFARFQPDQKAQLIGQFQKIDYVVSMVGDGANDCGALKAAHVGVSLSQAEASVAAPFTSMVNDISCLIDLILEGRCALVTSFAIFKYMALYSLIQFITIIILYHGLQSCCRRNDLSARWCQRKT